MSYLNFGSSSTKILLIVAFGLITLFAYILNLSIINGTKRLKEKPYLVIQNFIYRTVTTKGIARIINGKKLKRYKEYDIGNDLKGSVYSNTNAKTKTEFFGTPKVILTNGYIFKFPQGIKHNSITKNAFFGVLNSTFNAKTNILSSDDKYIVKSGKTTIIGKKFTLNKKSGYMKAYNVNGNKLKNGVKHKNK